LYTWKNILEEGESKTRQEVLRAAEMPDQTQAKRANEGNIVYDRNRRAAF